MPEKRKSYLTEKGAEALRAEYRELFHVERPKLVETVAWAASNGDRSENADYQYGKKRLREIDRRLKYLSDKLESATVVDVEKLESETIVFGATVYLENEDGQEKVYQIVGEDEIDAEKGCISWKAPLGKALLGKSVDDDVDVEGPGGVKSYTVLKFCFV